MTLNGTTMTTPTGDFSLVVDDGTIVAAGFCPVSDLAARLHEDVEVVDDLGPVSRTMERYFAGEPTAFDDLPVQQKGTPHQQAVWNALRDIPAGETVTYGELAARLGLPPGASRSVGTACGANLVAPIVPCHRVVRTGGGLGGYYYGLPTKQWLLDHESTTGRLL